MEDENGSFQEIYERFHPGFLRFLSRLLGEDEAEDVAQEVFLRVNRRLEDFRGDSAVGTWIYRIARNGGGRRVARRKIWRVRSPSSTGRVRMRWESAPAYGRRMRHSPRPKKSWMASWGDSFRIEKRSEYTDTPPPFLPWRHVNSRECHSRNVLIYD